MKKLTAIVAGFLLLISASAFTTPIDVSAKVKTEFAKNLASASNVNWELKQDYYIASFKMNGQEMSAAYDEDGEFICVSRYVSLSQLPLNVTRALDSKFSGYKIDEKVIEVSGEGTSWIITAENEKCKVKINADGTGYLTIADKTKKK